MLGYTALKYRRQQPYIFREGEYRYEFTYNNGYSAAWVKDEHVPYLLTRKDSCCATRTPQLSFSVMTNSERAAWQSPEAVSNYVPESI